MDWGSLLLFFKQKTAYEMRASDWSSYECSSDLTPQAPVGEGAGSNALRLRELQALRFRVVRCDQNDLKRAIEALGPLAQSGHVQTADGNENGDFALLSPLYSRKPRNPFPGLASEKWCRSPAIMFGATRHASATAQG